jgi:ribosomal protein S18 acetylase RimI-like enzyme
MMVTSTPWKELGYRREQCVAILRAGLEETQVAVGPDASLRGFVCLQRGALIGQPYVKLLCVAEATRGRGVGRALMAWAETQAFERWGARNLFLLVSDFNTAARAFYAHLGFAEVGRLPDYVIAGRDELILRKTRGPLLVAREG